MAFLTGVYYIRPYKGIRNGELTSFQAGDFKDGTWFLVGDEAQQLPHRSHSGIREGEVNSTSHASRERDCAQHEHHHMVHVLIVWQVEHKFISSDLLGVGLDLQWTSDIILII